MLRPSACSDPDLRMPCADLPVDWIGFFTKVDQHIQMSQSILVLEENGPKDTIRNVIASHSQLLTWEYPTSVVTEMKHPEQWFLTSFGSWTSSPPLDNLARFMSPPPQIHPWRGGGWQAPERTVQRPCSPLVWSTSPGHLALFPGLSFWEGHTDEGDGW